MHLVKLWLAILLAGASAVAIMRPERDMRGQPTALPTPASAQVSLAVGSPGDPIARNGSASLAVPVSLTLDGELLGIPDDAPAPSVTVHVDGVAIPGTVAGKRYAASLSYLPPTATVSVTVQSGAIRYHAWVGSMARLKRLARGNSVLSARDAHGLKVGPWSTALAAIARAELGGREPHSDAEYEAAQEHMRGPDLAWIAFLLEQYAYEQRRLPEGFATGHDVALSADALRGELQSLGYVPNTWTHTLVGYTFNMAPISAVVDPASLPATWLARYPRARGELPINLGVLTLFRDGANGYDVYQHASTNDPHHESEWLPDGTLRLIPAAPVAVTTYETTWFSHGVAVRIDWRSDRMTWRRITDGDDVDLWQLVQDWSLSYPDYPAQPADTSRGMQIVSVRDLASVVRSNAWAQLEGQRRTLPTMCIRTVASRKVIQACDTAIHRFDAGGTGMTEDVGVKVSSRMTPQAGTAGVDFSWSRRADGSVELQYASGATTRLWATDGEPGLDLVLTRAALREDGIDYFVTESVLSIVPMAVPFTRPHVTGTWYSGIAEARPLGYPRETHAFQIVRNPEGSGELIDRGFNYDARFPQTWSLFGERVYDVRTMARFANTGNGSSPVTDCATAFAQGAVACSPTYVRYLRPLRRVGNRVYGIEEIHTQQILREQGDTSPYPDNSISTRSSYQRCVAGECLGYAIEPAFAQPLQSVARPMTSPADAGQPREPARGRRGARPPR